MTLVNLVVECNLVSKRRYLMLPIKGAACTVSTWLGITSVSVFSPKNEGFKEVIGLLAPKSKKKRVK